MSASEKLKALDAAMPNIWTPLSSEYAAIRTALPQIVAVVEAAEIAYDGFGEDDHRFYGSQKRIVAALAALDEALL